MDPVAATTRHLLLPLWAALTGSSLLRDLRRFRESQRWPEERLREHQWRGVRAMLHHAHARSPFYRARFAALGLEPGDVRSLEDYARLPLLTRDDLRQGGRRLLASGLDPARLERKRTGGSTGVPVELWWDRAAAQTKHALTLRHNGWAGFHVATPRAALWGDVQPRRGLQRRLKGFLYARTFALDTLRMDERSLLAFAGRIRRSRIRHLFGHGHSLYEFARALRERGEAGLELAGVISSAEMLPPEERRVVEEVLGAVVFDRYGCEEVGIIASECEAHQGLHVAAEGLLVEVLDGEGPEPGRVVVTDLVNRATPLLRYEIGDLASLRPGRCPCGRTLPRLGHLTGRASDFLHAPDGRRVSGISLLDTVTIHIPGLRQVQVVQERLDELTFRVVRDERFGPESLRLLAEGVTRYFGPAMRHRVVLVDRVERTGRGKYQFSNLQAAGLTEGPGGTPSPRMAGRGGAR